MTKVRETLGLLVTSILVAGCLCLLQLPAQGADVSKKNTTPRLKSTMHQISIITPDS